MSTVAYTLQWKRQSGDGSEFGDEDDNNNTDQGGWWWSSTGLTVRYIIVAVLFVLLLVYFVGGYSHATRRQRKGLAPLPYHRWMVQRRGWTSGSRYNPYQQQYASPPNAYGMEGYAPPPPAYNNEHAPPPAYQPPIGGSKVMADQNIATVYPQQECVGESSTAVAAPPPVRY